MNINCGLLGRLIFALIICFLFAGTNIVFAEEIVFSLNQSEYYFLVGQDAIIVMGVNNTHGKQIDGQLIYTITQEINQGGFYSSKVHSQSKSFIVEKGETEMNFAFGTSDQPITLKVKLEFNYNEWGQIKVELNEFSIYFVENQNQQKNEENQMQSSSEKSEQQSQEPQQSPQEPKQHPASSKIQNNQMNQDTKALKQQMDKQVQEQKQMEEEFKKNLENNSELQKKQQELMDKGYTPEETSFDPSANDSGKFEFNYSKPGGEKASLKGEMKNGTMENLRSLTEEDKQEMLQKLGENKQFQEFNKEQLKGLNQTQPLFEQITQNRTKITVPYNNSEGKSMNITAEYIDGEIEKVSLSEKKDEEKSNNLWWVLLVLLACIIGWILYNKYFKPAPQTEIAEINLNKPINYKKEAKRMIVEAEKLFDDKKEKDAYEKVSRGVRFYFSYKLGTKKEITNTDLLKLMRQKKIGKYLDVQKCLGMCSLVEFAKYKPNRKDFDKIIGIAKKVVV
ncbi:MAG: hypothetical protein KAT28_03135 [Candidatus Aenigmarchaeota archaeon]|nr:hypothetical protein [Candidatus Aenigmarchaeota archaeon]